MASTWRCLRTVIKDRYVFGMNTNQPKTRDEDIHDMQIGALLGRAEDASIVDRLMDMPPDGGAGVTEWDVAVARRLQGMLAQTMRAMIEDEPERRRA